MSSAPLTPPYTGPVAIPLPGGTLHLDIARSLRPLDELCAFAVRRSARRSFLIVSKVLGRHLPARPSVMRAAARDLAALVPADPPGPMLVVGLAETAVCLGQSVHEELVRLGREAAFVHSTRQAGDHPLLGRFDEPHSHAASHLIYRPRGVDLGAVRSLVLVDDEVSTGTTLANLSAALVAVLPGVERIALASLTDWSGGTGWLSRLPRPARSVSLLAGSLRWQAGPAPAESEPAPPAAHAFGTMPAPDFGRLGAAGPFAQPDPPPLAPGTPLRIVGTGEFTYPPFLLAERLEQEGHDVVVQAASRSPVKIGGPIASALCFRDNYGAGVPNYLYNAAGGDGRRTIVCHETPPGSVDPELIAALGAAALHFEGGRPCAR
ncbi:MAG TPA: phosphoribosyltransferase domain-containing protein [Allosphingosinicella sp.]|nr:phosphoribosyltransferase domain-containing protein [Allosphingosinicella sp.]